MNVTHLDGIGIRYFPMPYWQRGKQKGEWKRGRKLVCPPSQTIWGNDDIISFFNQPDIFDRRFFVIWIVDYARQPQLFEVPPATPFIEGLVEYSDGIEGLKANIAEVLSAEFGKL